MDKNKLQARLRDHILSEVLLSKKWNGLSLMEIAGAFCEALFHLGYESSEFDNSQKKAKLKAKR